MADAGTGKSTARRGCRQRPALSETFRGGRLYCPRAGQPRRPPRRLVHEVSWKPQWHSETRWSRHGARQNNITTRSNTIQPKKATTVILSVFACIFGYACHCASFLLGGVPRSNHKSCGTMSSCSLKTTNHNSSVEQSTMTALALTLFCPSVFVSVFTAG